MGRTGIICLVTGAVAVIWSFIGYWTYRLNKMWKDYHSESAGGVVLRDTVNGFEVKELCRTVACLESAVRDLRVTVVQLDAKVAHLCTGHDLLGCGSTYFNKSS